MTLIVRGSIFAAAAAILGSLAVDAARAQSFYDAITAVARTEVRKPEAPKPAAQNSRPGTAVAGQQSPAIIKPEAGPTQPPATKVIKEDGYRYVPAANQNAKAWPNAEVQIARARCNFLLRQIAAEVVALDPIKDGACGDPAPVKLVSVGSRPKVAFDPPVVVNCDMVQSLHDWIVKDLQVLARRHLKSPIAAVDTMSSYSCRNAYGRKDTKLSQHARANAIDIRGFRTAKDRKTRLLAHWGPTQRDIAAAQLKAKALAEAKTQAKATTAANAHAKRESGVPEVKTAASVTAATAKQPEQEIATNEAPAAVLDLLPRLSFRPSFGDSMGRTALGIAPSRLGGPAIASIRDDEPEKAPAWPVLLVSDKIDMSRASTPSARFLRDAHRTACKFFGTVLGPEANHAHRNHFHVDRAHRALGNYCR
ncbi:MAG: extensin family protein [Alphaproteobacteria bacterium]|nr:extensin family protein [Alphaproteobacteria bacterium]